MAVSATTSTSQVSNIGLQEFLRILTSQLSNQDPLKPMDNQEFVAQLAQFAALEQSAQLNQKLEQLLSVQSAVQSVGLLGKTVDVNTQSGTITGQVKELNFSNGEAQLTVLTASNATISGISLSQIISVR
ncbi:MAG: flagellar hook capping protein [Burkholderiales bacterium]|nr:flagellar hook capping protein [Burkholderiales bacterium]